MAQFEIGFPLAIEQKAFWYQGKLLRPSVQVTRGMKA
jgi:hypothetical protein